MRTLFLFLSALALAGCGGSIRFVKHVDPCARPVLIPEQGVSDRDVETLWGQDRVALLDCGDKVEVLSGREPVGFGPM